MTKRLQKILNIQKSEGRTVALVLTYAIFLYFSNMMARTASMGLFLGEYDAGTLPYTYLFLMVVGPLISLVYLRLNSRFALSKVLVGIHVFLLLTLIALPLLINRLAAPVLLFTLPIYFGVNLSLTISSFWNLLGRIYNLRQGKRLFSLLSSGEHMATIVAGFLAPLLVARIGTANLYGIGAFFMALAIFVLVLLNRANTTKMGTVVAGKGKRSRTANIVDLSKEPYIRLIFALFSLLIIVFYIVDNITYTQAEIRFPTADEMAGYVGVFMGIFGILSLLVQWVVAGRVLNRFGVGSMIMATPIGLFGLMLLFALVGTFTEWSAALFWLAAGANMYQFVLYAIGSAAINTLYQPLPVHQRTQAQTAVIGVIYPLSMGVTGLLLIFLLEVLLFDSVQLSYAALVIIVIWLAAGIKMGRAYPERLRQALQERSLGGLASFKPDRASISVFENALGSQHSNVVLYALGMLQEIAPETVPGHLPALLAYPDDAVQIAALNHIAQLSLPAASTSVNQLLSESSQPAVRVAALKTLYTIDPELVTPNLSVYSRDPQPALRQVALSIMRVHDDQLLSQRALATMDDLAAADDAQDRMVVAGIIGETAVSADMPLLLNLLSDDSLPVRQAALDAAAEACFPEVWPTVISALAADDTRTQAVVALVAGAETTLPAMEEAFAASDQDPSLVAGITTVLGRIGGPQVIAILEMHINHPNLNLRHQILAALSRSAYQVEAQNRGAVDKQLQTEAAAIAEIVAAQVDIGSQQRLFMLATTLEETRQIHTDNIFLLLSFFGESEVVLSAREALQSGTIDEEKKAYAIEALDILLAQEHKQYLPFLQTMDPQQRAAALEKRFPHELLGREQRLYALQAAAPEEIGRWTRICAINALGYRGDTESILETTVRFADDPLLAETAINCLVEQDRSLSEIAAKYPELEPAIARWHARDARAMTTLQKIEILKQVSIFSHLAVDVLQTIASLLMDSWVTAGETIIHQGDRGDHLYVVVDGELQLHHGQRLYDTLAPGEVVGEMSLLDSQPRSASVTAIVDSYLLQLDQEPFFSLLESQPRVARDLMGLLSHRLRERTVDLSRASQAPEARAAMPVVGEALGAVPGVAIQRELLDLDKVFVLKGTELFGHSDDQILEQIALLLEEVNLTGGEELFHQGDPGQSLYLVGMGQVRVHIGDRTLGYTGAGEVLGEMALLESAPRLAAVTAVIPSLLFRLDQEPFFELLTVQHHLMRSIITTLSSRLRVRLQLLASLPVESNISTGVGNKQQGV